MVDFPETPTEASESNQRVDTKPESKPVLSKQERSDVLWLARVGYSETKRAHEQVLVMWTVRNRVETEYKGSTYQEVATYPKQFSGLQDRAHNPHYEHNMSLGFDTKNHVWERALEIAKQVYKAPDYMRPFPQTTRHFYSPVAMDQPPLWAVEHDSKAIHLVRDRKAVSSSTKYIRFAFYDGVR